MKDDIDAAAHFMAPIRKALDRTGVVRFSGGELTLQAGISKHEAERQMRAAGFSDKELKTVLNAPIWS